MLLLLGVEVVVANVNAEDDDVTGKALESKLAVVVGATVVLKLPIDVLDAKLELFPLPIVGELELVVL